MRKITFFMLFSIAITFANAQTIRYVTPNGAGNKSGLSWNNASNDLQLMVNNSQVGDEVWVSAGQYSPVRPAYDLSFVDTFNRDNSFVLKKDVQIFGGFAGNESSRDERNWNTHRTILDGYVIDPNYAVFCQHLVIAVNNVGNACLDGFILQFGANGYSDSISVGGQTVRNDCGGGIYLSASSPLLNNLIIRNNIANEGAGIYMTNNSAPVIVNTLVYSNGLTQGGVGSAGGIKCVNSSPTLVNTTISQNDGGGIRNESSSPKIYNSVIYWNYGGEVVNDLFSHPTYRHSLVWQITQTDAYGNLDGSNDPLFTDITRNNFDIHPYASPCINKGNDTCLPSHITRDLAGNPRIVGPCVDMGAYESQFLNPYARAVTPILFVSQNVSGGDSSGSSWANAMPDLFKAMLTARFSDSVQEVWVSENVYHPQPLDLTHEDSLVPLSKEKFFLLSNGIALYGGFPADADDIRNAPSTTSHLSSLTTEQARATRNPQIHPTILDGITANGDTACHVVVAVGCTDTATIDGFTIRGGKADNGNPKSIEGYKISDTHGGGIAVYASNLKINNILIKNNKAFNNGGAVYCDSSSVFFVNVTIDSNETTSYSSNGGGIYARKSFLDFNNVNISRNDSRYGGGGVFLFHSVLNAVKTNIFQNQANNGNIGSNGGGVYLSASVFTAVKTNIFQNQAQNGGGVYASNSSLRGLQVVQNTAEKNGGGIYNYVNENNTLPALENIAVINNEASKGNGGGIYNSFASNNLSASFINLTVCNNKTPNVFAQWNRHEGIFNDSGSSIYTLNVYNSVMADNWTPTTSKNNYYNCYYASTSTLPGNNNYNNYSGINPAFVNTIRDNYRLHYSSDLIDKGDSTFLSLDNRLDADGYPRVWRSNVDLGAYEATPRPDTSGILYINHLLNGDGSSWKNAMTDFADALICAKADPNIRQIWVARGEYKPKYKAADTTLSGAYTTDRHKSFVMIEGLKCYGGFAGWEENINQRKLIDNPTVLNGDLLGNGNFQNKCFHVVIFSGSAEPNVVMDEDVDSLIVDGVLLNGKILNETRLDGFIIENGYAYGTGSIIVNGGTINDSYGAGIYNLVHSASPMKPALGFGLVIDHCIIRNNYAITGGGIYNSGSFYKAANGTIHQKINQSFIYNSLIHDNTAGGGGGGGIYSQDYTFLDIGGSTIVNNTNIGIYNSGINQSIFIDGTIIKYNTPQDFYYPSLNYSRISNSLIGGITKSKEYILTINFVREANLDGNTNPQFNQNYYLQYSSPCINRGGAYCNGMDLDGYPRTHQGWMDMGAYERSVVPDSLGRVYVNQDISLATGNNSGNSWVNAVPELAFSMISAHYDTTIKEIWASQGEYSPSMYHNAYRDYVRNPYPPAFSNIILAQAFILPENVKIYGGFSGNGTETDISQRNWEIYPTVLNGNFPLNQTEMEAGLHVVVSVGNTAASVLDGFIITDGQLENPNYSYEWNLWRSNGIWDTSHITPITTIYCGSGIYNQNSSAVYRNLIIEGNAQAHRGSGMYNEYSFPLLENVTISGNKAVEGGGLCNIYSAPIINQSLIANNTVIGDRCKGAGMYSFHSAPRISQTRFQGNTAINGMGGGLYSEQSSPFLYKTTITKNTALRGGGLFNELSDTQLDSTTISFNRAVQDGGGTYNFYSDPVFSEVVIANNQAEDGNGGGAYNEQSSPKHNRVTFSGNIAYNGGGLFNAYNSHPEFENTEFIENQAGQGGGIYNFQSSYELTGITVTDNYASSVGGGIFLSDFSNLDISNIVINDNAAGSAGGGISLSGGSSDIVRLINVLLHDNYATQGGAVQVNFGTCEMINLTASENHDNNSDLQCVKNNAKLYIRNSILYNNTTSNAALSFNTFIDNSLVQGANIAGVGNNNLSGNTNPQFVNPVGKDFRLSNSSPCVDAGNNAYMGLKLLGEDLAGNPRLYGNDIDMGAFEYQIVPNSSGILFVKQNNTGGDGSSWANAVSEFSTALQAANLNAKVSQIWVADGTYSPSANSDREIYFVLPNDVEIYGGFPATANDISHASLSDRPVDSTYFGNTILNGNGCYHVVVAGGNSHLDGFTIENGNADNQLFGEYGGGILVNDFARLKHLEIRNNQAQSGGGAAVMSGCPHLERIHIYDNNAQNRGGGLYCEQTGLYAKYLNLYQNTAVQGGGIACYNNTPNPIMPVFENVSLHNNNAHWEGGAIHNEQTNPLFLNTLIYGNNSGNGSAVYNDGTSTIQFVHATIYDHSPVSIVPGGNFQAENCIICVNGLPPVGGNNYDGGGICPHLFKDAGSGDYSLEVSWVAALTTTPYATIPAAGFCINPSDLLQTDLAGNPRITGGQSCYGAYEDNPSNPSFNHQKPWKSMDYNEDSQNQEPLPFSQKAAQWNLQIYPNPTTGKLTISLPSPPAPKGGDASKEGDYTAENIEIYDVVGQKLNNYQLSIVNYQLIIDVSHLANGMYFLKIENKTVKFVKE